MNLKKKDLFSLTSQVDVLKKDLAKSQTEVSDLLLQKSVLQTDLNICRQELNSWIERCSETDSKLQELASGRLTELLSTHERDLDSIAFEMSRSVEQLEEHINQTDVNK